MTPAERAKEIIADLGGLILNPIKTLILDTGSMIIFLGESVRLLFAKPSRFNEVIRHMEFIGNQSVGIICLTGAFTGLALSMQIYLGFKLFNAVNLVGPVVALGITRELGPVLTGLIVAARAATINPVNTGPNSRVIPSATTGPTRFTALNNLKPK